MTRSLLEKLCCPMDKHELHVDIITKTEEGEIVEALMNCPHCHRYFPVVYGIPILIPDEYRDKSLEAPMLKKWGVQLKDSTEEVSFLLEEKEDNKS